MAAREEATCAVAETSLVAGIVVAAHRALYLPAHLICPPDLRWTRLLKPSGRLPSGPNERRNSVLKPWTPLEVANMLQASMQAGGPSKA